jgi:alkanesulfonate monooxygenase SsuD/methylene tetrahydromethanopterin reductase-like flavin-dependent oxidoreductase (luciferase family)
MRIGTGIGYANGMKEAAKHVADLEKAGVDVVWVAEAYGVDGVSLMGYLAAITERVQIGSGILPIYTRTPTLLAMTAAGVDLLSEGRCILGLGASGPQVIEGFHGVPYDAPLGRRAPGSASRSSSSPTRCARRSRSSWRRSVRRTWR